MLNVPFAIADATTLTEAGYVGEDVENILLRLIQAADFDVERAERGIIYIDEMDKIARKSENPSITRDVSRRGCAAGAAEDPGRDDRRGARRRAGASTRSRSSSISIPRTFSSSAAARSTGWTRSSKTARTARAMGFGVGDHEQDGKEPRRDPRAGAAATTLIKYGIIPELVGRLPVIAPLNSLDREALERILTEPKNAITKQYTALMALDGVKLEFDHAAIEAIADKALEMEIGARGLRSILEKIMTDIMFRVPSDKSIKRVIITADCVKDGKPPVALRNDNSDSV